VDALMTAEQAVLGAVLLEPRRLAELEDLRPPDFYRPVHQAVFAAMRTLRAQGHPAMTASSGVPLSWVTGIAEEAGRQVRGVTPSYAHTLVEACPRPANAALYGRMVLEGAIHRSVAEHAHRLHQAAASAAPGEAGSTLEQATALLGALDDAAGRWGTPARPVSPGREFRASAESAPPGSEQQLHAEQGLLAVLVEGGVSAREAVPWLRAGDFTEPLHGRLYQCLDALHRRGEPVDAVTVLWEAQRRKLLVPGQVEAEEVLRICRSTGAGSADWLGQRVLAASLARSAAACAQSVRTLAADPSLSPGRLLGHALHCLQPLEETRSRWEQALGSSLPPPRSAAAATGSRVQAALARTPHPAPPRTVATGHPPIRPQPLAAARTRTEPTR